MVHHFKTIQVNMVMSGIPSDQRKKCVISKEEAVTDTSDCCDVPVAS